LVVLSPDPIPVIAFIVLHFVASPFRFRVRPPVSPSASFFVAILETINYVLTKISKTLDRVCCTSAACVVKIVACALRCITVRSPTS
jgi:hypothetical protein